MAAKKFRLLEQGAASGHPAFDGREVGDEFEHDFYNPDTGLNHETAVVAAGWVELAPEKSTRKKEG